MELVKKMLKYGVLVYLIYIFIFSFVIYSFHPSSNKETETNILSNQHKNDRVTLIESPEQAITARLDLIESAETVLDIAYYKWADGDVSDLMLGSVLEAADRGVEVRILLDGILQLGSLGTRVDEAFRGFKSHPNIEIKVYEPFNPLVPIAWNNRMHDKIILVENKFGLIGGRNIEDRFYLNDAHKDGLVKDREVLVYNDKQSSSVLDDMDKYYDSLWDYKHSKEKHPRMTERKVKKADALLTEIRTQHQDYKKDFLLKNFPNLKMINWAKESLPAETVHFISNSLGRLNQDPHALKSILKLSEDATDSIFIQSPYFIPSRKMLPIVQDYTIDSDKATLFTNSEAVSPNVVAISTYNNRRKFLVDSGAKVFEYQGPGSTHGKSAIFDEQVSVVGTFNVDPRSSFINTESMIVIDSEEFADQLKKEIGEDFANSLQVASDYEYVEKKQVEPLNLKPVKKLAIRLLSLITPFFEKLL